MVAVAAQEKAPVQSIVPVNMSFDRQFQLALEPTNMDSAYKAASLVAQVGLCGVKSPEEALIRIMTGRSLGLQMMAALRYVYVVEGRPALDASFMHALCMGREDCAKFDCVEDTNEAVTYVVQRRGRPEFKVRYTLEDARRAQLLNRGSDPSKNNWNKWPRRMLHARCKSEGAQRGWPDVMCGIPGGEAFSHGVIEVVGEEVLDEPFDGETAATPHVSNVVPIRDAAEVLEGEPVLARAATIPAPGGTPAPQPPQSPPPVKEPPKKAPAPKKAPEPAPEPKQEEEEVEPPTSPPPPAPPPSPPPAATPPAPAPFIPQAAARDFDRELEVILAGIRAAASAEDIAKVRKQIVDWDAPNAWKTKAKEAYNARVKP